MPSLTSIFVYGTLKQGEVRDRAWPRSPLRIVPATVHGALYDLGPYPALIAGPDRVYGELWTFAPDDLTPTLEVLDAIEGYANTPHDLYVRRNIACHFPDGSTQFAWTYLFARKEGLVSARRIMAEHAGICQWSARPVQEARPRTR